MCMGIPGTSLDESLEIGFPEMPEARRNADTNISDSAVLSTDIEGTCHNSCENADLSTSSLPDDVPGEDSNNEAIEETVISELSKHGLDHLPL
jgi:hypothetical protein